MTAVNPLRKLTWPLLLAAIAAFPACHHRLGIRTNQVRVEVVTVGFDHDSGTPFVLLEEKAGKRQLPISIGENEARAIMLELHGISPQRPLTSDLLRSVIEKTGNRVDRVVIDDMREQTYYADIYLSGGRYRIDSRPSDAIALALGMKAPIFVAVKLFESAPAASAGQSRQTGPKRSAPWASPCRICRRKSRTTLTLNREAACWSPTSGARRRKPGSSAATY